MKKIILAIQSIFKNTNVIENDFLNTDIEHYGSKDYIKSNIINKNILSEIIKTDFVRIDLISNMNQSLTLELNELKLYEQSEENLREIKWIKEVLSKNEKRLEKLQTRGESSQKSDNKISKEFKIQIAELRKYIIEDKIDLYFDKLNSIELINDLESEEVLLKGRYNQLEKDNRQNLVPRLHYISGKVEIFLELLNLIDEICERKNILFENNNEI